MSNHKDKVERNWEHQGNNGAKRERDSISKPDGVFNLVEEVRTHRRKVANIDGNPKSREMISFDSADKLAEEVAALRDKK
ncbi:hypothetical protein H2Y56_11310 [Pectobacterium aroidearum]|uniref:DNA-binding protein n=1 Tax=Pectobacterium aroidearum TaxID=1201031 RepID=A0ABR5ZDP3_9GAMM|nr:MULTISPECIES: hypothetical protein [Pectobacterium]MBA5199906.1 hypothetical protein [Pectobacterium aroidearum]MBA5228102.1 hypothetical protein [Pectobacterium aroidearum]MBA5232698.1 hypothetical protein [Pectobacterium aroidearum]MBA5737626.1 hypothetical protein [Pectobacterium aroidearum]UXK01823.1 hypothetical protein N5056_07670 [Pectobacterium aroidearum]